MLPMAQPSPDSTGLYFSLETLRLSIICFTSTFAVDYLLVVYVTASICSLLSSHGSCQANGKQQVMLTSLCRSLITSSTASTSMILVGIPTRSTESALLQ